MWNLSFIYNLAQNYEEAIRRRFQLCYSKLTATLSSELMKCSIRAIEYCKSRSWCTIKSNGFWGTMRWWLYNVHISHHCFKFNCAFQMPVATLKKMNWYSLQLYKVLIIIGFFSTAINYTVNGTFLFPKIVTIP